MNALKIKKGTTSKSAYNLRSNLGDEIETHTLAVTVDNEAGVLARVIGLFSGRGYNIESLTVTEIDHEENLSKITIVTKQPRVDTRPAGDDHAHRRQRVLYDCVCGQGNKLNCRASLCASYPGRL